jgi:uncharacterized protein (TIGR02246 family)
MRRILLAMTLTASVSSAYAGPKEDAYQVVEKWGKAFTASDVDAIVRLYAPDALMIGTLGKVVLEEIRKYFEIALNTNKPRSASLNGAEALVVDDSTVIISPLDTVTGVKDGQPVIGLGRVTFVVAKRGSDWLIVHLHRSPLPAT